MPYYSVGRLDRNIESSKKSNLITGCLQPFREPRIISRFQVCLEAALGVKLHVPYADLSLTQIF